MLPHLLISLVGAGLFLRIVGKEANRRYRHLLLRVELAKRVMAEANKPQDAPVNTGGNEEPVILQEAPASQAA